LERWTRGQHEILMWNEGPGGSEGERPRRYERQHTLGGTRYRASSAHGVIVQTNDVDIASLLIMAGGGASGVHRGESFLAAIGPFVVRLSVPSLAIEWTLQVDSATCFGIHESPGGGALISHGELDIARLTDDGKPLWSASGADVFSEPIRITEHSISARDFAGRSYEFDIATGAVLDTHAPLI
jgi:hypothetical protein